jgi:polysaccharide pyruvyl transferase WcaK-like protein
MRIVVETALNRGAAEYQNMGDVAMLQVAVTRLRRLWTSASVEVITDSSENLSIYCPEAKAIPRVGCDLWVNDKVLLGKYHKYLPAGISAALSRMKKSFGLGWPKILSCILCLRLYIRGRGSECKDLLQFVDAIINADLFLVCGAGGFADTCKEWNTSRLNILESVIQRHIPVAMFGQGIGPLKDPDVISRAKNIFPKVSLITLRGGRGGAELLKSFGVPDSRMLTSGDEAIELAYEARSRELGRGLGINLRVASYAHIEQGFVERLRPIVQQFARRHSIPMIPVPIALHRWANDHLTIRQLLAGFDDISDGGLSLDIPLKVIKQVGHCRIIVTGAYHAAVFALAQGIPAVCLAKSPYYEAKFLGLEDQFGLGCETILLEDEDAFRKIIPAMERAWESAETLRIPLLRASLRQIELSRSAYEQVRDLVNTPINK